MASKKITRNMGSNYISSYFYSTNAWSLMMSKIIIGCRLPHGIILELKNTSGEIERIELKGINFITKNNELIIEHKASQSLFDGRAYGSDFVTTEIDGDFWNKWKST